MAWSHICDAIAEQHLPDEVLGLVNNFILHKISDSGVINPLKRSIELLMMKVYGLASLALLQVKLLCP